MIDRKTASKLLKVSVRTIDRYIRGGKLKAKEDNGRIWLNKEQIMRMGGQSVAVASAPVRAPARRASQERQTFTAHSTPMSTTTIDNDFYKDLYEEAKRALSENQQKLQQSNYRIGQLESQIIHPTAPAPKIPEFTLPKISKDDSPVIEMLKKDIIEREKEIVAIKEALRSEHGNRMVFTVMTYLLLAAIPALWFLMR